MKDIITHLEKIRKLERKRLHPLIHEVHKKHKISKKTLLYVKEYGPHSHALRTIIRESIKILLLASLISSFGGLALEHVKLVFVSILPLVILLPTLNDMLGDYGTIISSRFSTMLHEGKIKSDPSKNKEMIKMYKQILAVAMLTGIFSASIALLISTHSGYEATPEIILKILLIIAADIIIIVSLLFLIAVNVGWRMHKKEEDPNNFLIPITTSLADFGNMVILFVLISMFF
ncbi:MAG TPA: magnesium transporter [Candidatus Nanoarchaeia archaeon]|nr:magnesium transporter [Candidatus Nanoarchaeia archaeon]